MQFVRPRPAQKVDGDNAPTPLAGNGAWLHRAESHPIPDRCPHIQVSVVDLNAARIAAWNDPDLTQLPVDESGLFRFSPGSVRMIQSLSPMTPRL